jgi:methyltransferase (TIGR00027 family)
MTDHHAQTRTAYGPMLIAACEQLRPAGQRVVDDSLAIKFLPAGQRATVKACRFSPVLNLLVKATDSEAAGLWAEMLCRKRYADDQVAAALEAGLKQFVFLGSGLDTRPYRLVVPAHARAFELDLPANIDYKREHLADALGEQPSNAALIAVDFEQDDLAEKLAANGFDPAQPAMFVWEAVTQYLTEDGVRRTLASFATTPAGSRLIFTFVRSDFLDGTRDFGAAKIRDSFVTKHHTWNFGLSPEGVARFVREYGWTEREQVGATEYRERYLAPIGRDQDVSEIERFVYATR